MGKANLHVSERPFFPAEPILTTVWGALRSVGIAAAVYFYIGLATPDAASLVILVSATLSSVAGFAFSAIAGPALFHITADPIQAVQIMLVASIALQAHSVWALRKFVKVRDLLPYFAGGLATVLPGVYLLLNTPTEIYLLALGAFLIVYASYMLLRPAVRLGGNSLAGRILVGALGGITGATAAFPGAFVTIWCAAHSWDKLRQRAIYQPFILVMQLVTMAILAIAMPTKFMPLDLVQCVVPAVAGSYLGLGVFSLLNMQQFNRAVSLLLLAAGTAMLIRSF